MTKRVAEYMRLSNIQLLRPAVQNVADEVDKQEFDADLEAESGQTIDLEFLKVRAQVYLDHVNNDRGTVAIDDVQLANEGTIIPVMAKEDVPANFWTLELHVLYYGFLKAVDNNVEKEPNFLALLVQSNSSGLDANEIERKSRKEKKRERRYDMIYDLLIQ
jgi:hypothetical protein